MALVVSIRRSDEAPQQGLAPAALLLHGWGGDERSMAVFEAAFGPGWWLIRPRAPYPLPQGGSAWYLLQPDGGPDPRTVAEGLAQLIRLLDELPQRLPIDPNRWLLVGFSQGAAMAARLALEVPARLIGVAAFSGFPLEIPLPAPPPPLMGLPAFIAYGQHDPLVPAERARELCRQLSRLGAETTCVEYPGGHKAGPEAWRAFRDWLSRLAPPPA